MHVKATPYRDLVPPLSTEEKEVLAADLKANGQLVDALVDEDGNLLDGHHRYDVLGKKLRVRVVKGLSDPEKRATVIRMAVNRRNLSPSQKAEVRRTQQAICRALKAEGKTQQAIALQLGVPRESVRNWLTTVGQSANGSNGHAVTTKGKPRKRNVGPADSRVKVDPRAKPKIANRVNEGEPQAQVAADFGLSQQAVSNIVRQENKTAEVKQQRQAAAKKRAGNCGVIAGDFRIGMLGLEDDGVDLIFTDPPYAQEAVKLYADIAKLSAQKLTPGGWLLAYSGKDHLPDIYAAIGKHLTYAWTFCVLHSGGDARFRKYRLQTGWKPIVAYYKPPLQVDWDWFKDVTSGGKEKAEHPWQQAVAEATHFIERLCPKGGLVCDPCAGSGTTLLAAKQLGRKWIGYEQDTDHAETARSRLDDQKFSASR